MTVTVVDKLLLVVRCVTLAFSQMCEHVGREVVEVAGKGKVASICPTEVKQ